METKVIKISNEICASELCEAAEIIKAGGLVVFPTETVYGLGADATNPAAAKKIYASKIKKQDSGFTESK